MRHHGISIDSVAGTLGELVSVHDAIAQGRYSPELLDHTGQVSIAVASEYTGPQLAIRAGRQALAGMQHRLCWHLHASVHDVGLDFWSPSSYIADRLGVDAAMTMSINAMSNSAVAGLELAASVLTARGDQEQVLRTTGDSFAMPRFDAWQTDSGIAYGDGGTALVLAHRSARPAVAELVSTACYADPGLEGLHRGNQPFHHGHLPRAPIQLRQRKAQSLAIHDGPTEVDVRNALGVGIVTAQALHDAGLEDLDRLRWVLCPHYGAALIERHCLTPLGIPPQRTLAHLGQRYGHIGAGDQFLGLAHLSEHGLFDPGDYALLLGIGVGMSWSAAILRAGPARPR